MIYLGPIYPRKWGPIEISHFLSPLPSIYDKNLKKVYLRYLGLKIFHWL